MKLNWSPSFKEKLRAFSMVFALIMIWVVFNFRTEGAFLQARNISNLLRQSSVTGILSVGMVLVIVAGYVDLSVGAVVAFLGGLLALLISQHQMNSVLALMLVLAAGMAIGLLQGALVAYQNIPAFIVTLGGMMAFRGATMWLLNNNTIPLPDNWIKELGTSYIGAQWGWPMTAMAWLFFVAVLFKGRASRKQYGLEVGSPLSLIFQLVLGSVLILGSVGFLMSYQGFIPVMLMLALCFLFYFISTQTPWGRHIYAIGRDKEAALLSGIHVSRNSLSTFILMGFLAGISAVVLTARVDASPDAGQLLG